MGKKDDTIQSSGLNDNDENKDIAEINEILESVPEEQKGTILKMMISSVQMKSMSSSENTISKKITEEHITQFLDVSKADMENSYAEKKQKKIFVFASLFLVMVFFVIIIILLKDIPDVMEKIIYSVVGLVAGAIGGYGYGKIKKDD